MAFMQPYSDPFIAAGLPPGGLPGMTGPQLQAAVSRTTVPPGPAPVYNGGSVVAKPLLFQAQETMPGAEVGEEVGIFGTIWNVISPWLLPLLGIAGGAAAGAIFGGDGNGEEAPGALVPLGGNGGGALAPQAGRYGSNVEAFLDFGGFGKGSPQAEGWIAANRTTDGTGIISAETFRAWDPIQQRYYQLHGTNPYSNITLMPGRVLPGIGGFITKSWVTHAWRRDGSLASTQMAMTSTGKMLSLSETGVMKNWRPYKSIVIGKTLTSRNLRRVSTRVKSHQKSLKGILKVLK